MDKLYLTIMCIFIYESECVVPYNDVKADYETLLSAYRMQDSLEIAEIVPKDLASGPIQVYVGIGLYSIMDYDEVSGRIQLVASMKMEWLDEMKTITGTTFKEALQTVFVSFDQIWTPELVLMSAVDSVESIGDETYKVRYNVSSGYCKWYPRMIINAACSPDMTYYPFDKQTCALTVTPWNHDSSSVELVALTNEWNTNKLEKSSTWDLGETSSEIYINSNNSRYHIDFKITIKRKPFFLALVIVLPVLLLSLLSGFLFLLPPGSGERVGFGITCFLSFVVLLQTIMSFMPEISSPMSILCFYVIIMLCFSVLLSVANVFLLRMYMDQSKDDVPWFFSIAIEVITCKIWRRCPKCPKINIKIPDIILKCLRRGKSVDLQVKDVVYNERFSKRIHFKDQSVSGDSHSTENDSGFYIGDDDDDDDEEDSNNTLTSSNQSSGMSRFRMARNPSSIITRSQERTYQGDGNLRLDQLEIQSDRSLNVYRPSLLSNTDRISKSVQPKSPMKNSNTSRSTKETKLTWKYLAQILDLFFIVVFCAVQTVFTIFYLVPLGAQY